MRARHQSIRAAPAPTDNTTSSSRTHVFQRADNGFDDLRIGNFEREILQRDFTWRRAVFATWIIQIGEQIGRDDGVAAVGQALRRTFRPGIKAVNVVQKNDGGGSLGGGKLVHGFLDFNGVNELRA